MTGLHKIWHDDAEPVSEVHRPLKLFFFKFKMADGRSEIAIFRFSRWRPSCIFEIELFNSRALQSHVLHHRAMKVCLIHWAS